MSSNTANSLKSMAEFNLGRFKTLFHLFLFVYCQVTCRKLHNRFYTYTKFIQCSLSSHCTPFSRVTFSNSNFPYGGLQMIKDHKGHVENIISVSLVCFIYILDCSNSSSLTFWSSQFPSRSRSKWTSIWTGNSNGSWTDKQSSHFSTVKEMSVKATFFFI